MFNILDVIVDQYNTEYSYQTKITWNSIKTSDTGSYECRVSPISDAVYSDTRTVYIEVHGKRMLFMIMILILNVYS